MFTPEQVCIHTLNILCGEDVQSLVSLKIYNTLSSESVGGAADFFYQFSFGGAHLLFEADHILVPGVLRLSEALLP